MFTVVVATQNAYLPTMAEDVLPQVQAVLNSQGNPTGRFYGASYLYACHDQSIIYLMQNVQWDIDILWER